MAAAQYRESLLEDDRRADAVTVLADDILKFDTVRPKWAPQCRIATALPP